MFAPMMAAASGGSLDPSDMSITSEALSAAGITKTIDSGDYIIVAFRTNNPTTDYGMYYIKNYTATAIKSYADVTVSVTGTTLTITRNGSTAITVVTEKLS